MFDLIVALNLFLYQKYIKEHNYCFISFPMKIESKRRYISSEVIVAGAVY